MVLYVMDVMLSLLLGTAISAQYATISITVANVRQQSPTHILS